MAYRPKTPGKAPRLLGFLMRGMLAATAAELRELQPTRGRLLVLRRRVIPFLTHRALQCHDFTHTLYYPFKPLVLPNLATHHQTATGAKRSEEIRASRRRRLRPYGEYYLMISEMVPAPTVRPPSRIANLSPFSIATGVCSSISSATLSPGITISVPSGSFAVPVTSVVRK